MACFLFRQFRQEVGRLVGFHFFENVGGAVTTQVLENGRLHLGGRFLDDVGDLGVVKGLQELAALVVA